MKRILLYKRKLMTLKFLVKKLYQEEKVIANDNDQRTDFVNELMKTIPEKIRGYDDIKRKVNDSIKF